MTSSDDMRWTVNMTLEGLTLPLKTDSESDLNILPMTHYKKIKRKPEMKLTKIGLTSNSGDKIPIMGKTNINVKRKGSLRELYLIIILRNVQPIQGKDM